jgi:hypothetical protein
LRNTTRLGLAVRADQSVGANDFLRALAMACARLAPSSRALTNELDCRESNSTPDSSPELIQPCSGDLDAEISDIEDAVDVLAELSVLPYQAGGFLQCCVMISRLVLDQ